MALVHLVDEHEEIANMCVERIVNIFYIFSQAENQVKETIAERSVLKSTAVFYSISGKFADFRTGVLKDLKKIPPLHQITMLKFIKNLSMLTATLETLHNANAIEVLTDLLKASMNGTHFRVYYTSIFIEPLQQGLTT